MQSKNKRGFNLGIKFWGANILTLGLCAIIGCSAEQNDQPVAKKEQEKQATTQKLAQSKQSADKAWGEARQNTRTERGQERRPSQHAKEDFSGRYTTLSSNIRSRPIIKNNRKKDKIVVVEFFNYGCPACNAIEPALERWKASLGDNVEFTRIPVVFHTGWLPLAKAYYAAEQLKMQDEITPYLFAAIHQKKENLMNKKSLETFFQAHKVPVKKFDDAYNSFYTNRSLERGRMLMTLFGVYSIPTIVVNDTYKTDVRKAGGNPKQFISVLNYLVKKAGQENKAKLN